MKHDFKVKCKMGFFCASGMFFPIFFCNKVIVNLTVS